MNKELALMDEGVELSPKSAVRSTAQVAGKVLSGNFRPQQTFDEAVGTGKRYFLGALGKFAKSLYRDVLGAPGEVADSIYTRLAENQGAVYSLVQDALNGRNHGIKVSYVSNSELESHAHDFEGVRGVAAFWKHVSGQRVAYIPDRDAVKETYKVSDKRAIDAIQWDLLSHEVPEAVLNAGEGETHVKYEAARLYALKGLAESGGKKEKDVYSAALYLHQLREDNKRNAGFTQAVRGYFKPMDSDKALYKCRISELFSGRGQLKEAA